MPDGKPGNGYDSPFGNGKGATMAQGSSSGAHNFLKDPESGASKEGGRDFTKESRPQEPIDHTPDGGCYDPASVPQGGPLPFPAADPSKGEQSRENNPGVADKAPVPFKNLR